MTALRKQRALGLCLGWLVLLGLQAPAVTAGGTESSRALAAENLSQKIVWHQAWDGQRIAVFIPRAVMERMALESLPLDDSSRTGLIRKTTGAPDFRASLEASRQVDLADCDPPPGGPPKSVSTDQGMPLDAWIATREELGVVGSVVAVVDGWTTATNQAAQLVYVQVDSILHNEGQRYVAEGDLVSFLQYAGDFNAYGERVCTRTYPDQFLAQEGDVLLLAGTARPHDDTAMSASVVFPVLQGLIYPVGTGCRRLGDGCPEDIPRDPRLRRSRERCCARRTQLHYGG